MNDYMLRARMGVVGPSGGIILDIIHDGALHVLELPPEMAEGFAEQLLSCVAAALDAKESGTTLPVIEADPSPKNEIH